MGSEMFFLPHEEEEIDCLRAARSNRRKNRVLVHLQVQWLMK